MLYIFMNTFIRQASDSNNTDRQTAYTYTCVYLCKLVALCQPFIKDYDDDHVQFL